MSGVQEAHGLGLPTTDDLAQLATRYVRDGFAGPLDVLSEEEAADLRDDLETAEAALAADTEAAGLLHPYANRLLPSFHDLTRHPTILAAASAVLGSDLIVWGAHVFAKEAQSPHMVSWHQDLTYWGFADADELTCWVALSPATAESGCMRFVPGTHRKEIVPHNDTFRADNLLTRGQEIAVTVDEADAVAVALQPGQASIHHGRLFHASGPNTSNDRRIGVAIRYITPMMRQQSGVRPLVSLVQGVDRYGHFTLADPPRGRLDADDIARCQADAALRSRVLYAGTDPRARQTLSLIVGARAGAPMRHPARA